MKRLLVAAICAIAATLALTPALAPAGQAEETACSGLLTGVVAGDVVVPAGSTCTLEQAEISGSVIVEPEAWLRGNATIQGDVDLGPRARLAVSDTMIGGDVVCRSCERVVMSFMSGIGGDVSVTGMRDGYLSWDGVQVAGSVKVTGNSGDFTFIDTGTQRNFVFADNVGTAGFWYSGSAYPGEGQLRVVGNSGAFHLESTYSGTLIFSDNVGAAELIYNYAEKHLQCFGNDPAPTGYYNEAGKSVQGQCPPLGPEAYPED